MCGNPFPLRSHHARAYRQHLRRFLAGVNYLMSTATTGTRELAEMAAKVLAKHAPTGGLTDREALRRIGKLFIGPKILAKRGDPFSRLVVKAENVLHQNSTTALTDAQAIDKLYGIFDGSKCNGLLAICWASKARKSPKNENNFRSSKLAF
jgi:hypothetical protein